MQTLDNLSQAFVDSHAQDAAPLAESLPPDQSCALLMRLPDAAAAMLAALPLPTGAAILRRMEPARVAILIKMMDPKRAGPLGRLLQFPERTVGALVDPAAFTLPADITIGGARPRAAVREGHPVPSVRCGPRRKPGPRPESS